MLGSVRDELYDSLFTKTSPWLKWDREKMTSDLPFFQSSYSLTVWPRCHQGKVLPVFTFILFYYHTSQLCPTEKNLYSSVLF